MSEPVYGWLIYRLYSFLRYPESAFFRPSQLASMGFYSSGRGEEVTCYGCGVSHTNFHPRQSIRRAHRQRSPDCPLNLNGTGLQADDAGAADDLVAQNLPVPLPNRDRPKDKHRIAYFSWERMTKVVFRRSKPNFELLVAEGIRLRRYTFYDWPAHYGDWEQLTYRGFFYTGKRDRIRCCMCGIFYRARLLQDQTDLQVREGVCLSSCRPYFIFN